MNKTAIRSDLLLLLTAIIWGFAFVAQRVGMNYVGPFTFNAIRFALGSISLLPLIMYARKHKSRGLDTTGKAEPDEESLPNEDEGPANVNQKQFLYGSLVAGSFLFIAASLQQIGIQYTTAGKAGFLTGLYVVLVPIVGMLWGRSTGLPTWVGAILAVIGIYTLSAPDELGKVNKGDIFVLISALFWTFHVLVIDKLAKRLEPIELAAGQFAWCSVFSFVAAIIFEQISFNAVLGALVPILYGGLGSVGVGYTLQVLAQRDAPPAHSSIIMCLEGVFATLGGILLLSESPSLRTIIGSVLMLLGMLATQWEVIFRGPSKQKRTD
ncbi:MAG TPA: DMT family transporter [Rectinema sp.]|nr:DMT family transporter [Rectinema sp.]